MAALPWLGSVFKSIELPGGVRAEYRERLAVVEEKVAEVERAVFRGGSPELRGRLAVVLDHFAAYLAAIGLKVEGPVPEVDVSGAPEGFLSAYDASSDRILIDPVVADDTASTLHEYAHLALLRTIGAAGFGGPLAAVENALCAYLVCAFQGSPRLYRDGEVAREYGLDRWRLDRDTHVAELDDMSEPRERGRVWGEAFWQVRAAGPPETVDGAVARTWRATAPDSDEAAFSVALADELRRAGGSELADRLLEIVVAKGLLAEASA